MSLRMALYCFSGWPFRSILTAECGRLISTVRTRPFIPWIRQLRRAVCQSYLPALQLVPSNTIMVLNFSIIDCYYDNSSIRINITLYICSRIGWPMCPSISIFWVILYSGRVLLCVHKFSDELVLGTSLWSTGLVIYRLYFHRSLFGQFSKGSAVNKGFYVSKCGVEFGFSWNNTL